MITTLWKYPEKKNYKVYAILSPLFANYNSLAKHLNMLCMSIQKIVHCIVGTLYKLTARINREIAFAASSLLHSYYLLPTDHFDCKVCLILPSVLQSWCLLSARMNNKFSTSHCPIHLISPGGLRNNMSHLNTQLISTNCTKLLRFFSRVGVDEGWPLQLE